MFVWKKGFANRRWKLSYSWCQNNSNNIKDELEEDIDKVHSLSNYK